MSKSTIKNLIISAVLFFVVAGGFGFYLTQFVGQADTLTEQIENLAAQREQEKSFFTLQKISDESSDERELIASYFLKNEGGSIDLLNKVEGLAPAAGVQLETEGLELIEDKTDGSDWVEIGFSIKGTRDKTQNFISAMEQLPYVSKMMSVNLRSINSSQWDAEVVLRVRVLNYDE